MDYEEKYNAALERAKKLQETCDSTTVVGWCEYIFPELKESEDGENKRISKEITQFLKQNNGWNREWLAWLEKQGETFTKKDVDDAYLKGVCDAKHELEKQDKQPTDNDEPKFKVGDWFVNNTSKDVFLIKSINNGYYSLEDINGSIIAPCLPPCESESHLWSTKDVKNGDILAEDSCIFIIQKLSDNGTSAKTYCSLYNDGDFEEGATLYFDIDSTKPATKEQRDLLFQKMADAGYEWDGEKKGLKKIESKTLDPDKVIEWFCVNWWDSHIGNPIDKFKKDFGL